MTCRATPLRRRRRSFPSPRRRLRPRGRRRPSRNAAPDEVAGAPAIDPQLLLALWVYATSEGEGSARELGRLTRCHDAYRWLCGGVEVGDHTLSDFRSQQGAVLDELITQVL